MPFIDYDIFVKYAHPAVIEYFDNSNDFSDYENTAANLIKTLANISIPTDTSQTESWIVPQVVAIISKLALNKMQNTSTEFQKLILDNYNNAIDILKSIKSDVGLTLVSQIYGGY